MNKIAKQLMTIASDIIIAEELIKIAQQLEQFTGAEANLYRKDLKKSLEESKKNVLNKYNTK